MIFSKIKPVLLAGAFFCCLLPAQDKTADADYKAQLAAAEKRLADKDAEIKLRDAHIQWLNQKLFQLQSKLNGLQIYIGADEALLQLEASKPAPIPPTTPTTPTTTTPTTTPSADSKK